MPANRPSPGKFIRSFGIHAGAAIAVSLLLLACAQSLQKTMVGYWTPGNSCDRRFFEMTNDLKFYQWKWEKNWDGYSRISKVKPSSYALSKKNEITISGTDGRGKTQRIIGKVERISDDKIKISDVKATRDNQPVKDAPREIILIRCDESVAELLKK